MNLLKSKPLLTLTAIVLVVIGLGFFLFKFYFKTEVLKLKTGSVVESIYGLGTVSADKIFHVRAGLTLMIQKMFVSEGDQVKPGDPIVKLEDNIMKTPIEGTVTSLGYKEGELVTPQALIATVTNLQHLYLEVSLEQQSVLRIKKDQKVYVSFESLRNEKCEGRVETVYPRDNQFIIRIEMNQWPDGVLPGMTADVAILVGKKENVLLIPIRSIKAGLVTRLRDGKKEKIPIKLGIIDGEWGEVTSENLVESDELLAR